jgi:hypothetical protein
MRVRMSIAFLLPDATRGHHTIGAAQAPGAVAKLVLAASRLSNAPLIHALHTPIVGRNRLFLLIL